MHYTKLLFLKILNNLALSIFVFMSTKKFLQLKKKIKTIKSIFKIFQRYFKLNAYQNKISRTKFQINQLHHK